MQYPKFLKDNDTIKLVAPSLGCTTSPYEERLVSAINYMSKTYKIKEGELIYEYYKACSGTKKERAKEINESFLDKEVDVIASVGGGEVMSDFLEYIDFDNIKANPKFFFGYSDNTNLTFTMNILSDTASIYSINFPTFGLKPLDESAYDTLKLLRGEKLKFKGYKKHLAPSDKKFDPLDGIVPDTPNIYKISTDKSVHLEGRLIGGCLDILRYYPGTEFDKVNDFITKYQDDKILWFFECCDLNPIEIYLALTQLRRAGWFKNTSGIIFGRPLASYKVENFLGYDEYEAAKDALSGLDLPMAFDLDFGHVPLSVPILSGSYAKVDVSKENFEIEYVLK